MFWHFDMQIKSLDAQVDMTQFTQLYVILRNVLHSALCHSTEYHGTLKCKLKAQVPIFNSMLRSKWVRYTFDSPFSHFHDFKQNVPSCSAGIIILLCGILLSVKVLQNPDENTSSLCFL
jgi:hypothetical protein